LATTWFVFLHRWAVGHLALLAVLEVDDPEVGRGGRGFLLARRHRAANEDQPLAIGRPGGVDVELIVEGDPPLIGPVGVHDVELEISVALAGEGDAPAVRGIARDEVLGRVVGQIRLRRAVRPHVVDLVVAVAVAHEGDAAVFARECPERR
jgi:hypothetical protein